MSFPQILTRFLEEKGFETGEIMTIARCYSNHQPSKREVKSVLDKIDKLSDNKGMVNVTKHLRSKL